MSVKRQATNELNHENWDQEDPEEHEEMGSFKSATKDILEKRVIRTAKRRAPVSGGEAKKSVFSGFGGFNKTQPSSFDFLANLTNGSTNANGTPNKNETSVTSSLFSSKSPISSTGSSVFGTQETTTSNKPNFGIPMSQTSSLFGGSLATSTALTGFTATKADSTVGDTPFKIQPVSSSADTKTTNANSNASPSQVSSTIFGIPSTSANTNKSLFSTNSNSSPLKIQPVSSTTTTVATGFGIMTKAASNTTISENKVEAKSDEKRMKYYSKLKGLNGCVSDWIKKHVEETPLCILSPIFKDYEKYLKEIQDEFHSPEKGESNKLSDTKSTPAETMILENVTSSKSTSANSNNSVKTVFNAEPTSKPSVLGTQSNAINKPSFSFGINTNSTSSSTNTTTTNTGFSFGTTSPQVTTANTSTSFSFGTNTNTATTNGTAPFSFGIGKPFTFNSNIQSNSEKTNNENEDEEEPPKVEFTPVVEENTVFEKRCKIFVKKDGNFADKGVGTLYIKKIAESGKHQLLVRANTSLGNILINLILASAIPTQRMGKNNIMMVCIPTPDSKPPPTPVLIRVKTSEEADDLLNTLNKYKL